MRPLAFFLLLCFVPASASASPATSDSKAPAKPLTAADVDKLLATEWRKNHVTPAGPVDDARFLRRLYLDLTGAIPPAEAVLAFLDDRSRDKRARAVDQLLEQGRYADHFTDYWDKVLLGRVVAGNLVDRDAFRAWLRDQLDRNEGWNVIVEKLVTATGQNSLGGVPGQQMAKGKTPPAKNAKVNGAVNWLLKYQGDPQDLAGKLSRVFLGVQIQCAQCHDHPSEKWKQTDFRQLAAAFAKTGLTRLDDGKQPGIQRVLVRDQQNNAFGGPKNSELREIADSPPRALDGTALDGNRRKLLADWITKPDNPYFARAFVNRMWAYFLGRGFVDPVDDFRRSNAASAPEILDRVAADFVAHGYDVKRLIKLIASTRAYQLASAPAKGPGDAEDKLWGHYRLRTMSPEALLASLVVATDVNELIERYAGQNLEKVRAQIKQLVTFLFDVDEESDQAEYEGTIPQSLMLINGQLWNSAASSLPGTALETVLAMPVSDEEKIDAIYLRALSRHATSNEARRWVAYVNAERDVVDTGKPKRPPKEARQPGVNKGKAAPPDPMRRVAVRFRADGMTPKQQAFEDVFWALLNSSEFFFRH